MESDGSNPLQVATKSVDSKGQIQFMPDGDRIVFSARSNGNYTAIYSVNIDGSGIEQLTTDDVTDTSPAISPDGFQIAFIRVPWGEFLEGDIYIMDASGTNTTKLTDGVYASVDGGLEFSPDGSQIVYTSELGNTNTSQIFIVEASGSESIQITSDQAQSMYPCFKH